MSVWINGNSKNAIEHSGSPTLTITLFRDEEKTVPI
jgi:hypothetical protein